jgi:Big-like domain-containing protein
MNCGSDHTTLTGVSVSPQQATGTATVGKVQFTATGSFSNNSNRQLSSSDGVNWTSSDTSTATIDGDGGASCLNNGVVNITATVPANKGANNTSSDKSGTATLKCLLAG